MRKPTARTPVETRFTGEARRRARAIERSERRIATLQRQVDADRTWIRNRIMQETSRFRRTIPADPYLLDLLGSIDVEHGDVWRWRGGTNNHGVPTVRRPRAGASERTVVRVLAEAFGLFGADDHGVLYPTGDRYDVNPFHRVLRRAERRLGNPHRYDDEAAS
jgi:hypothetical protein